MQRILSENIGKLMILRGYTQNELAELSGLSRATINRLSSINRDSDPKFSSIMKIAKALDADFIQLLTRGPSTFKNFDSNMTLDDYLTIFIGNVKRVLNERKQKELSVEPGLSESTVSELLNKNVSDHKLSTLFLISEQIGIPLPELFKRKG